MDMEDLVKEGKEAEACPYYATRYFKKKLQYLRFKFVCKV